MLLKLRQLEWTRYAVPFVTPFVTAHGALYVRTGLIVRLHTNAGFVGLGEAAPLPGFGGTLADSTRVLDALVQRLVGSTLEEIDALLAVLDVTQPGVAAVACAVDTAVCDIRARAQDITIARFLSADAGTSAQVNATIGDPLSANAAAAAVRARDASFGAVKLKVGVAASKREEVDRIAAVREALGPAIRLRLDANGAWTVAEAIAIIGAAERFDLELVEQPVAADDLAGMARVRRSVATPIAADEAVTGIEAARRVIEVGAADLLVVKPMLAGGLRPAKAIIDLAGNAGLRAIVTTMLDTGVGVAAALQLACTLPEPRPACGLATGSLLTADLVQPELKVEAGAMRLPPGPGLGVMLDEEQISRKAPF